MRRSWCTVSKRACSTGMPTGCESASACPRGSTALQAEDRAFWQRVRLLRSAIAGPGSRLEQIVDWCGGEAFDGALVLDECHVRHRLPRSQAFCAESLEAGMEDRVQHPCCVH